MGPTFYRCIESMCRLVCWNHARLVVSFFNPSEKYDFVSWDDEIPNTSIAYGKTKNVPNHQPDVRVCVLKLCLFHSVSMYVNVCYTVIPLHLKMEFGTRSHSSRKYVPTQMWNVIICLARYTACWHANHWSVAPPKLVNRKNLNSRILNHPSVYQVRNSFRVFPYPWFIVILDLLHVSSYRACFNADLNALNSFARKLVGTTSSFCRQI